MFPYWTPKQLAEYFKQWQRMQQTYIYSLFNWYGIKKLGFYRENKPKGDEEDEEVGLTASENDEE